MLTFPASVIINGTKACVDINVIDDIIVEDTENFQLTLSNPFPASIVLGPNANLTIVDNDSKYSIH